VARGAAGRWLVAWLVGGWACVVKVAEEIDRLACPVDAKKKHISDAPNLEFYNKSAPTGLSSESLGAASRVPALRDFREACTPPRSR